MKASMTTGRLRIAFLMLVAALLAPQLAMACPICLSGKFVAPGQRIDAAEEVVLAEPGGAAGRYRVTEVIKGTFAVGDVVSNVVAAPIARDTTGAVELLVQNKLSSHWTSLGRTAASEAPWLRSFVEAEPASGQVGWGWLGGPAQASAADIASWSKRLATVAPRFESGDRLAAAIAYGELARAPYAATRSLKAEVDPNELTAWIGDDAPAERRSGYILLLGIVGGPAERNLSEERLAGLAASGGYADLAAVVAGDLELSGPSRLPWIEDAYLATRPRTLPEIEAVLLALSVQGTADAAVPRSDIVQVYRRFVQRHPAMAGFVAPNLAEWRDFSAAGDMEAAVRSGVIKDAGSQFAVLSYLKDAAAVGIRN